MHMDILSLAYVIGMAALVPTALFGFICRRQRRALAAVREHRKTDRQMAAAAVGQARHQIARLQAELTESKLREKRLIERYVTPAKCDPPTGTRVVADDALDLDLRIVRQ